MTAEMIQKTRLMLIPSIYNIFRPYMSASRPAKRSPHPNAMLNELATWCGQSRNVSRDRPWDQATPTAHPLRLKLCDVQIACSSGDDLDHSCRRTGLLRYKYDHFA